MRPEAAIVVALCGIAIAVGAVLPWSKPRGIRPGASLTHTSVTGLVHWGYHDASPFTRSVAIVVLVLGVLVVLCGVFGLRLLAGLFCLLALAAGGAWLYLYASRYSTVNLPYSDLRAGAWLTLIGGFVGLIAASFLRKPRDLSYL